MLDNKTSIDEFFRQQHQQLPPATSPDTDWAAMNQLLDEVPKRRLCKRTTRRIIQWMGGLALVTTVTYYAVQQKRAVQKNRPITVIASLRPAATPTPATMVTDTNSSKKSMPSVKTVTHKSRLTAPTPPRQQPLYQRMVRQESDTVLIETASTIPRTETASTSTPSQPQVAFNWLQQLASPPAVFEIDPQRDTMLICPQGTVLRVFAHSFVAKGGNRFVNSPVQITVKECYNYADMLANRLSTNTANDVLATGGMLHISATTLNDSVRPYLSRPLQIEMPFNNYDPAMQLYLPDGQQPNESGRTFSWQAAGQPQVYVNESSFTPRSHFKLLDVQQRVNRDTKSETAYFDVLPAVPLTEPQIKTLLRQRYPYGPEKMSISYIERAGRSSNIKGSEAKASEKGFIMLDEVSLPFKEALRKKLLRTQDSLAFTELIRQDSIQWREQVRQDSLAFVKKLEFSKTYSFNVSNLGWVNCDRIMAPGVPRAEFVIHCAPGAAPPLGLYHLILNNQKVILTGNYRNGSISFGLVPQGFSAQLICVHQQGDKVMSCVKPVQISMEVAMQLTFTETSPEKFKQQLAAMDAALVN